jgi:hypothetical protein
MADTSTLELLGEHLTQLRDEAHSTHLELCDMRRTMLMILELQQRIERRLDELRTDIGVVLKLEVSNAMQRFRGSSRSHRAAVTILCGRRGGARLDRV